MSVIGLGNTAAINLAGSVAGGVRTSGAEADRLREASMQRNAEANVQALVSQSLDDVAQTDHTADRDADGRMPFGFSDDEQPPELAREEITGSPDLQRPRHRVLDADGVRGGRLDLEA